MIILKPFILFSVYLQTPGNLALKCHKHLSSMPFCPEQWEVMPVLLLTHYGSSEEWNVSLMISAFLNNLFTQHFLWMVLEDKAGVHGVRTVDLYLHVSCVGIYRPMISSHLSPPELLFLPPSLLDKNWQRRKSKSKGLETHLKMPKPKYFLTCPWGNTFFF